MNEPRATQSIHSADSAVFEAADEQTIRDLLAALKRRIPLFLTVTLGLAIIVFVVAAILPSIYRSSAIVLIEQQEIPPELVQSTVTSYADQRIQTISQRVMTTSNLTEIMDEYGLYAEEREEEPTTTILARMRDDIGLEMISAEVMDPRSGRPTEATIAFEVSYQNRSPQLAQRVANELTNLYLSENIKNRTEMATETTSFLEEGAEELASQVAAIEAELAAFKEEHSDSLPEMSNLNLQIRERLTRELREVNTRLRSLDERIIYLEAEKAQIRPNDALYDENGRRLLGPADRLRLLETELIAARGRYSEDHPNVERLRREIAALRKELGQRDNRSTLLDEKAQIESKLAALRQRYGPEHPDVVTTEKQLEGLRTELAGIAATTAIEDSLEPDNPAYVQIQSELQAAQTERQSLIGTRNELKDRIEKVETALKGTPQVEREYRQLLRGYENAQATFQEVKSKQLQAQLAESLESERKGERFTLIEPPLLPEEPVKPNRLAILLVGLLLALFSGLGSVAASHSLDDSIRSPKDIMRCLDEPPLAVIPYILNARDVRSQHTRLILGTAITITAAVLCAAVLHFAVMPLDVIWLSLARRF